MPLGRTGTARPHSRNNRNGGQWAARLAAVLLVAFATTMLVMGSQRDAQQYQTGLSDCAAIADTADRLACFDKLALQPPPQPFKGALAPRL